MALVHKETMQVQVNLELLQISSYWYFRQETVAVERENKINAEVAQSVMVEYNNTYNR